MKMIFDTLKGSRKLRENGRVTEGQAVASAEAFGAGSMENLATQLDIAGVRTGIAEFRTELKGDIAPVRLEVAQLRTEVKTDRKDLENRLLIQKGRDVCVRIWRFGGIHPFY